MPQDNHSKLDAVRQDSGADLNPQTGKQYPVQPICFKAPLQVFNASYWEDSVACVATTVGIGPRGFVRASMVLDGIFVETTVKGVDLSGYTTLGHVLWIDEDDDEEFEYQKEEAEDEGEEDVRRFSIEAVNAWFASLCSEWQSFGQDLLDALAQEEQDNPQ